MTNTLKRLTATNIIVNFPKGFVSSMWRIFLLAFIFETTLISVTGRTVNAFAQISTVFDTGNFTTAGENGPLPLVIITAPEGLWVTTEGSIFIAESGDGGRVRRIDGKTKTVNSHIGLNFPTQLAFNGINSLYLGLAGNNQIILLDVVSSETVIIAGTSVGKSFYNDNMQATSTTLANPRGVWLDSTGVIYASEHTGHTMRRIDTSGIISIIAGRWGSNGYSGDGGQATSARFDHPLQIYGDTVSRLFIADMHNHRVRVINLNTGIIATLAGNGQSASTDVVQSATATPFHSPKGVWGDVYGNVVVTESGGSRIKYMNTLNIMSTIAGCGVISPIDASVSELIGDGGAPTAATFSNLKYVFIDTSGVVYFSDSGNNRVRKLYDHPSSPEASHFTVSERNRVVQRLLDFPPPTTSPTAQPSNFRSTQLEINTIAGTGLTVYNGNGIKATSAGLNTPSFVWSDAVGNVYICERGSHRVRKVNIMGIITIIAGTGAASPSGASTSAKIGDGGQATAAILWAPRQLFGDSYNNLYVSDGDNRRVRIINLSVGIINTFCGNGYATSTGNGGRATSASIYTPIGLWQDTVGQVYIGEHVGHLIRKVDILGIITTIAGTGVASGVGASTSAKIGDGGQATSATLYSPIQMYGDLSRSLCVVDKANNRVRSVSLDSGIITSVAGTGVATSSDSVGAASAIGINGPYGVFGDTTNYLYISEYVGSKIKLVNPSGIMLTLIGFVTATGNNGPEMNNGDGGAATAAVLGAPYGLFAINGDVYVGDDDYHRVRKIYDISPTNMPTFKPTTSPTTQQPSYFRSTQLEINTVAGTGLTVYNGDGIKATTAGINRPVGIWSDSVGNVYFCESTGHRVRKIDKLTHMIYVVAGGITPTAGASTSARIGDGGRATSAVNNAPYQVFGDQYNNLYVADYNNNRVRIINLATNIIKTFCGNGYATSTGNGGQVTSASVNKPVGLWLATVNHVYIGEHYGQIIRKVDLFGIITTIAGTGAASPAGASTSAKIGDDGQATSATFNNICQIYGDLSFSLCVADRDNRRVRCVQYDSGIIATIAGTGEAVSSNSEGVATSTGINEPRGLFGDSTGYLHISEANGSKIKLVNPSGIMVTLVGFVTATGSNGPQMNNGDGGAASAAVLGSPYGLFVETSSAVYVCESSYHKVRKIYNIEPTNMPTFKPTTYQSSQSLIATVAGTGGTVFNSDNIQATAAVVFGPHCSWGDSTGNLYISEFDGNRIRKVGANQIITTVAGKGIQSAVGTSTSAMIGDNGPATAATLSGAQQLMQNSVGDLYFADQNNNKIRLVSAGVVTTVAGTGASSPVGVEGAATSVPIVGPGGVWRDTMDNFFIAGSLSHMILKVTTTTKYVSVIVGRGTGGSGGDGGKATSAYLNYPYQLYGDTSSMYLYIGDLANNKIRRINLQTTIIETVVGTGEQLTTNVAGRATSCTLNYAYGVWLDMNGNMFVVESEGHKVKRIDLMGIISTVAGFNLPNSSTSLELNGDGGPPTAATFNLPHGVFVDSTGTVYIADVNNNKVRKLYEGTPTYSPTETPSMTPSIVPSALPTSQPSGQPLEQPSDQPSGQPSVQPFARPSSTPTSQPLCVPSFQPSDNPSSQPTTQPLIQPSCQPIGQPSEHPSVQPFARPSVIPTNQPQCVPSSQPSENPFGQPTAQPLIRPSRQPSGEPSSQPSSVPSIKPTGQPTHQPNAFPSAAPTMQPWNEPSSQPTTWPSSQPTQQPGVQPSNTPTSIPTMQPSSTPSSQPSIQPTSSPSCQPSAQPSKLPTLQPTSAPFSVPSCQPFRRPTSQPSMSPFTEPSAQPSMQPTMQPSSQPGSCPSSLPTIIPSNSPSRQPTTLPSGTPTILPSVLPTSCPSSQPSTVPSSRPSITPTLIPSTWPTSQPYGTPSSCPSVQPNVTPSQQPTSVPSSQPSCTPSCYPSDSPSHQPITWPTRQPSAQPSLQPSTTPSRQPTSQPSQRPLHPSAMPLKLGKSSIPTFANVQPNVSPTQLLSVSVNFSSGIVSEFKIVLPYMFTDSVSGNGRYDVQVPNATTGHGNLIFGSKFTTATFRIGSSSLNMFPIVSYDYTARSVSNAGDVNGDGYDDLIIGVPYASRCHVLFGNENGFVSMTEGFTITGSMVSDLFGWSVASAGDINNDTFADIIIGAPNGGGESSVGMAYILYGRRVWSDMDISELVDGDGFSVYGVMTQESLGVSVSSAGDINGDGYDDVIISALSMDSFFSGAIYVVFGQASMSHSAWSVRELTGSIGFAIEGPPWSWFGYSVSGAGDVNGDGVDDILIGSVSRKMVVETPVSYIIFGKKTGSFPVSVTSLSYAQGVRLTGGGIVVSSVGDVNGDGCDDILLGSDILFEGAGYVLAKPHTFPMLSADPTALPTFSPSSDPTHVPSQTPSVKPIAPTFTPSVAPTGPTFSPSMTPTQPTSVPTISPTAPSQAPSVVPTIAPSCWPSLSPTVQPSVSPSFKPSLCPTVIQTLIPTTRSPSYKPTIVVTLPPTNNPVARPSAMPVTTESPVIANITYSVVKVDSGVIVTRTLNDIHFIVNSTVDVVIEGVYGFAKFTIIPNANTSLTIEHFKPASDLIDLQAFKTLRIFSELTIRTGVELHSRHLLVEQYPSLIIMLPHEQRVLIANLTITQLSSKNFIFSRYSLEVPAIGTMKRSYGSVIVLCSVFGSIGLYLLYMFGGYLFDYLHIRRSKGRVTDWDSENVRNNPTYVSFHINDSDRSIFSDRSMFSDISSDSEGDGDMDSSIEISSRWLKSMTHDTAQAIAMVKIDNRTSHVGSIQSKDSSTSSDLQTQQSVYESLSSSDHGRVNGRDMYGIQHADSTKEDDSVDYKEDEDEGHSSYTSSMHSSEEVIDTEVGGVQISYHNSDHNARSSSQQFDQTVDNHVIEHSTSVHNSLQYAHQQLYHNTEALQYFWSEEDQQWDESYREEYQQHQQQQELEGHVDNETGRQEHSVEYDLEANYSHQQR